MAKIKIKNLMNNERDGKNFPPIENIKSHTQKVLKIESIKYTNITPSIRNYHIIFIVSHYTLC